MLELERDKKSKITEIRIRTTQQEKEYIKVIAEKRGMTMSDYIRYCILRETKEGVINAMMKDGGKKYE